MWDGNINVIFEILTYSKGSFPSLRVVSILKVHSALLVLTVLERVCREPQTGLLVTEVAFLFAPAFFRVSDWSRKPVSKQITPEARQAFTRQKPIS